MEKAMAPDSSTLAWKIPWTEEPGRLQSRGSLKVGHNWAISLSLFTFLYWRKKWQPTLVFLPGESQGQGAWWAAVYGVTQSQTQLKQLSSSIIINVLFIIITSFSLFLVLNLVLSVYSQHSWGIRSFVWCLYLVLTEVWVSSLSACIHHRSRVFG